MTSPCDDIQCHISSTTFIKGLLNLLYSFFRMKTMNIDVTPVADLEICGTLRNFMEATRFNRCAPHDELGAGDTRWVLAAPGDTYIAYSEFESNPGGTPAASRRAVSRARCPG